MTDNEYSTLKIEDVAEILGVHKKTVYRMVRSGALPAIKAGRLWRIRRVDLEKILTPITGGHHGKTTDLDRVSEDV